MKNPQSSAGTPEATEPGSRLHTNAPSLPECTMRFVHALFGDAAGMCWVTHFPENPFAAQEIADKAAATKLQARMWGGGLLGGRIRRLAKGSNANQYICISTFLAKQWTDHLKRPQHSVKRRKEHFDQMHCVMVDDIGVKIARERIKLDFTAEVETSPGNCQGWYALDPNDPDTRDRELCERLIDQMVAAGLTKDGIDPGMKGVTRYGRLPAGINNKPGRPIWEVKVVGDICPERRYTVRQIAEAYDLDLTKKPAKTTRSAKRKLNGNGNGTHTAADSLVKRLEDAGLHPTDQGNGEKFDITCPWLADHTDEVDTGTAYMVPSAANDHAGGFKCHHGHCIDRHVGDLFRWLDAHERTKTAEAFRKMAQDRQESGTGEANAAPEVSNTPQTANNAQKAAPAADKGPQAEKTSDTRAYVLTDVGALLDTEFDPLVFITKGIIEMTAGAYILAGKPKHGKSWLAMGLTISSCTGETYLQTTPTEKGQAIYLACDDSSERRFKDRVITIKPQRALAGLMGVVTQWSPEADSTIAVLNEVAGKYPRLRIVVIDTLSAFRKGLRTDSPYQQEYDELKALNDWAHARGVIVIVVHHLRKGTVDPADPFESISGTLGLQGAVDGMLVLSRTDDRDGPTERKLAGFWMRARDTEGELNLGLELKNGRWLIVGTAADVFNASTQRLITQILREANGKWMTSKEIHATGLFDCKATTVLKAATRLAQKGEIESHHGAIEGNFGGGGGFRIAPGKN